MKWLLAVLLALAPLAPAADEERVRVYEHAEMSVDHGTVIPPDSAEWKPVTLPHAWYRDPPRYGTVAWYRFRYQHELWDPLRPVIFLPRVTVSIMDFYVNGNRLAMHLDHAPIGSPITALSVPIPRGLLRDGENVIHVRVRAFATWMQGMPRLRIGTGPDIAPIARAWRLLQSDVIVVFAFAFGLVGVLSLALWAVDRTESLAWYGACGIAYAVLVGFWYATYHVDIGARSASLIFLRFYGLIVPLLILQLRFAGWRLRWLEAGLWLLLVGAAVGVGVESYTRYRYWVGFGLLFSVLPLLAIPALLRPRAASRPAARATLALIAVLAASFGLHDHAVRAGILDFDRPWLIYYLVPLVLLASGGVIIGRYVAAMRRLRGANVELERRVEEKTREIETAHEAMRAIEQERTLRDERRRIMADMHDGVGSKLVALLSQVKSGGARAPELEGGLHDILQELRFAIDALQPVEGDIGVVLGNVRHRMRSLFERAGVRFDWRVPELPRMEHLTPARVLAIQRLLLQVFTNAIEHSRAKTVTVSAQRSDGEVCIRIEDDGRGFDPHGGGAGRGLENIRVRAAQAGGAVRVDSAPGGGTWVELTLPLAEDALPAATTAREAGPEPSPPVALEVSQEPAGNIAPRERAA